MVRGDAVPQEAQYARPVDVLDRPRCRRHAVEIRSPADVGRVRLPDEAVARGHGQAIPAGVSLEDLAVLRAEHRRLDRGPDDVVHFLGGRPDVLEIDGLAVLPLAERLLLQVEIDPPGERVRDDERRRGEIVGPYLLLDAPFKVTVA